MHTCVGLGYGSVIIWNEKCFAENIAIRRLWGVEYFSPQMISQNPCFPFLKLS